MNTKNIQDLLTEFNVSTEDELYEKLAQDVMKIKCTECPNEIPMQKAKFYNGDPYCNDCYDLYFSNAEINEDNINDL